MSDVPVEHYSQNFALTPELADEPVKMKCNKCEQPTYHDCLIVYGWRVQDRTLPIAQIRVLMCNECGVIRTSK